MEVIASTRWNEAVVVKGVFKGYVGRPVDHVRKDLPREGPPGVPLPEHIYSLLHPHDDAAAEECRYLVPGTLVSFQCPQKGLIVKLLGRYAPSQLFDVHRLTP